MRPFSPCNASRAIPKSILILKRRLDSLYETQDVPRDTCRHSTGARVYDHNSKRALCSPPHLKKRTDSPASIGEESQGVPRNVNGGLTSLKKSRRLPEVLLASQEEPQAYYCKSGKTTRFLTQGEMRPFPLQQFKSNPEFPFESR